MKTFLINLLVHSLLLTSTTLLIAQDFSHKMGEISSNELEMKNYKKDPNAEAVVIFDKGKSYFNRGAQGYEIVFERKTRLKIFTEAGIKWAEIEIPIYQEGGIYETVFDIKATAYNLENGQLKTTELNLNNVYEEKINQYWKNIKFALPNIKPGSVIEYTYKINSEYLFNLRDWEFQKRIPVMHSEYEVRMIPFYEYSFLLQGADRFDDQRSFVSAGLKRRHGSVEFKDMVHQYEMKDVPAFESEEFITSVSDYILKIDFQLKKVISPDGFETQIMTTWQDMISDLLKHKEFGKYTKKSGKMYKKIFGEKPSSQKPEKERFNKIVDHVKQHYRWNGMYGNFATQKPARLIKDKTVTKIKSPIPVLNLFKISIIFLLFILFLRLFTLLTPPSSCQLHYSFLICFSGIQLSHYFLFVHYYNSIT